MVNLLRRNNQTSPRFFLFGLSTARFSGMAATVLELTYFDPIVSKEKPQFLRPRHLHLKICKERSGAWLLHVHLPLSLVQFNIELVTLTLIIQAYILKLDLTNFKYYKKF